MAELPEYVKISRPRFWPYLLGPYAVGIAGAAAAGADVRLTWWLIVLGLFFTYPANFIIYGINDVYDYDTDKLNPKKVSKGSGKDSYEALVTPERRWLVMRHALTWIILGYLALEFVPGHNDAAAWSLLGFYFFGVLYSMPPVRAKAIPFLDSAFNILYIFPGLVGYALYAQAFPNWQIVLAATLWCMAMHAYSAIPDIAADAKAGLRTIATQLGFNGTLMFCVLCYAGAAVLSYRWLSWFSILAGTVYVSLMAATATNPTRSHVFRLYKYFPYVNIIVGMGLFFYILLG
jgi:4-hydroxybenzoate polyprenyltransferase